MDDDEKRAFDDFLRDAEIAGKDFEALERFAARMRAAGTPAPIIPKKGPSRRRKRWTRARGKPLNHW